MDGAGRVRRPGSHAVLPAATDFPYTIRVVSEITEQLYLVNKSSKVAALIQSAAQAMPL